MVWKYEGEFRWVIRDDSFGKKYYNPDLNLNLYVGENPSIRIKERFFVTIETSTYGIYKPRLQKWFTSEKDAYEFANTYMKKNR